jgi:hypothetical protein
LPVPPVRMASSRHGYGTRRGRAIVSFSLIPISFIEFHSTSCEAASPTTATINGNNLRSQVNSIIRHTEIQCARGYVSLRWYSTRCGLISFSSSSSVLSSSHHVLISSSRHQSTSLICGVLTKPPPPPPPLLPPPSPPPPPSGSRSPPLPFPRHSPLCCFHAAFLHQGRSGDARHVIDTHYV